MVEVGEVGVRKSRHCEKAFSADEAILMRSLTAIVVRLLRISQ
ncbi:hypothetical protein SRABI126_04447 [Pedobacter sp. Bi126]|nr:hypothetical protein SRABI126_04447 [Pedobacter sp. Bi126]